MSTQIVHKQNFEEVKTSMISGGMKQYPTAKRTSTAKLSVKSSKRGNSVTVCNFPFSGFIKSEKGKYLPAVKYSVDETLSMINSLNVACRFIQFFKDNMTAENIIDVKSLRGLFVDYFSITTRIATKAIKTLENSLIIRRVGKNYCIVNPYVLWHNHIGDNHHFQLQSFWDWSIDNHCKFDGVVKHTPEEIEQLNTETVNSLREATETVVKAYMKQERAIHKDTGMLSEEYKLLTETDGNKLKIQSLFYDFCISSLNYSPKSDSLTAEEVLHLLLNDANARLFYRYYKDSFDSLDDSIKFTFVYKRRNKVISLLLNIASD